MNICSQTRLILRFDYNNVIAFMGAKISISF